jgi:hypothetical protein
MKHTHYLMNIVFSILLLSLHFVTSTSRVARVNFVSKKWYLLSIALFYVGLRRPSPQIGIKAPIQSETNRCDPNWLWQGRRRERQQQIEDILIIIK